MAKDTSEPQSYGSGKDWVTGKTGQQVNDPKSEKPAEHRDFYDSRRSSEESSADQGGRVSEVQLADDGGAPVATNESERSSIGVSSHEGGAKRDSYFKKRDYE